jgi:hypothetical protein
MYRYPCLVCANAGYTESESQGPHVVTKRVLVTKLTSLTFIIVGLPVLLPVCNRGETHRRIVHGFSPRSPGAQSQSNLCGICGGENGTGQGFLRVLRFSRVKCHSAVLLIRSSDHRRCIGLVLANDRVVQ